MALDPRLNAYHEDLADARLRGQVKAGRFVEGRPARIVVGRAPVRRVPAADAPLDTYYHYGARVLVFEEAGGWGWCQSLEDGYVGYVEAPQNAIGKPAEPTHFVATMGSYLYAEPDMKSPPVDFLPRHSAVVVTEHGIMTRGSDYARLGTGQFVPLGCLSEEPPRSPISSPAPNAISVAPTNGAARAFSDSTAPGWCRTRSAISGLLCCATPTCSARGSARPWRSAARRSWRVAISYTCRVMC